ncbi:ABC transporter permease [Candidatus Aquiluna sp. UB-MaderosW2red]|uniref:ABC transporter permease n=1 Tax=Candidatus Aquiluna sp. UB-MaderosW2red TaxID=1855377 RepID=UPI0012F747F2|nr:ABC transporter permease [Candidatus Aquiluna sp. UB-MaderosW2red]
MENIATILEGAMLPAIVACALTVVLIMGQFDLSIQAMAGFATVFFAVLMANFNLTVISALLIMAVVAVILGLVNGWFVAYRGLNALVVTIATASLLNGGEFFVSDSKSISVGIDKSFVGFVRSDALGVPILVWITLAIAGLVWLMLDQTRFGRELKAVGSNSEAARFAGVNVRRVVMLGFVVSAALCVIAGVLYTGRQAQAYPLTGLEVLLPSFAACFIGAAMFKMGKFNIPGTLVGALLASIVANGLLLANVGGYTSYFFQGAILLGAVWFARIVTGKGGM